jgi:hypothetical protein
MRGELKFIGAVTVPAPPSMDPRGDEICRDSGFIALHLIAVNKCIVIGMIQ